MKSQWNKNLYINIPVINFWALLTYFLLFRTFDFIDLLKKKNQEKLVLNENIMKPQ